MNIYKEYIRRVRCVIMETVYIVLNDDVCPKLTEYVCLLNNVKFVDGSYHTYCGEIKHIVNSFIIYWTETIDEAIRAADKYAHIIDKDELLTLIESTINMHLNDQINFGKQYLPVQSALERQAYDEIERKHKEFMEKLYELRSRLEKLDKRELVEEFAKEHFPLSLKRKNDAFEFTHTFISMMLADRLHEIRTSLEEILLRVRNNLLKIQNDSVESLNALLNQLYDKHKEYLEESRRERRSSAENAEINRGIELIRGKIENYKNDAPIAHLEEEVAYWQVRLREFHQIAGTLNKLKAEQDSVVKQEEIYNSMKSIDLPGSKHQCWKNIEENFKERKKYLEEKIILAARALLTFFSVRGPNQMIYADNLGPYYMDEYGHQVYFFNHGYRVYHVDCEGTFKQAPDDDKYYFDDGGRYVIGKDGEKLYQCAPCCSTYNLANDNLLVKVTKDCGHSEKVNKECRMEIKDPTDVEVLPNTEVMNIKRTLNPDVVKYLWDSFGSILPDALHDVARAQPKNPIHYLAHKLLFHKYRRNVSELQNKKAEAETYRAAIIKERKEKAIAASKEWKSKQVRRRKPEESDDTHDWMTYDAHRATYDFINSLSYYND